jgi:hypothetical protein
MVRIPSSASSHSQKSDSASKAYCFCCTTRLPEPP